MDYLERINNIIKIPNKKFTDTQKYDFILYFSNTNNVSEACALVGIALSTAYKHRKEDPVFGEMWAEAEEHFNDMLQAEAVRRAVEGTEKGIWHQGKLVGIEQQYSDPLLMFLLKGKKPETFGNKVEHSVAQKTLVDLFEEMSLSKTVLPDNNDD